MITYYRYFNVDNGAAVTDIVDVVQEEFTQHFPKSGWVEHEANEIWDSQFGVLQRLVANHHLFQCLSER